MLTIKDHTPNGVLRAIREHYPKLGSEHLLRTFEAMVYDDAELRGIVIRHAFTAALMELSVQPREPTGA